MPRHATLKLVREQRHLDAEDVAAHTHISPTRLHDFEAGVREPTIKQLEKLALVYGVTSYQLACVERPNLPGSLPDFRKPVVSAAHLSPSAAQKVWTAESISEFGRQLALEVGLADPAWAKEVDGGPPTEKRASRLREYAHRLAGAAGVSNPFIARNATERTCNRFAAEFLAPMEELHRLVERQPRHIRQDPLALIRQVSGASLLSLHASAIRLVEGSYLTQAQLRATTPQFL